MNRYGIAINGVHDDLYELEIIGVDFKKVEGKKRRIKGAQAAVME